MEYIRADDSHAVALTELTALLWPGADACELQKEFGKISMDGNRAAFLCLESGKGIGFAEFSLRRDYVEGTDTRPVGYLEGIYVREQYRKRGIAGNLVRLGEAWAREMGCRQMASDCELPNEASREFHLRCGFSEANRIVCFVKDIRAIGKEQV